jgi:hypothetical protein
MIPLRDRKLSDVHFLRVAYDRTAKIVRFYIDNEEVYTLTKLVYYLADRSGVAVDRGGDEVDAGDIKQPCSAPAHAPRHV